LIDSGADDIIIDNALLKQVKAPTADLPPSAIKTVHGMEFLPRYWVHIAFPSTPFKVLIDVVGMDLVDGTRAYHAIFGMRFIERGTLHLCPRGESHFTFDQL
jgi:hypothetical protein